MSYTDTSITEKIGNVENCLPSLGVQSVIDEIIEGLLRSQKWISPKFFYDKIGSELFEQITHLPEYYLTRSEKEILSTLMSKMDFDWSGVNIIELGSGDPSKIQILLRQLEQKVLRSLSYYPVDISESAIITSVEAIEKEFQLKCIQGIIADFTQFPEQFVPHGRNLFCFLGSTLGNFEEKEVLSFLQFIGKAMKADDFFLLGIDLFKAQQVVEAAYNDSQGVTKAFNLNVLSHVNRLTNGNLNPLQFDHLAMFNSLESRIEMHLVCREDSEFCVAGHPISFKKGETIHTENSHKFTEEKIETLITKAGFTIVQRFVDRKQNFCELLLTKQSKL